MLLIGLLFFSWFIPQYEIKKVLFTLFLNHKLHYQRSLYKKYPIFTTTCLYCLTND